MCSTIKLHLIFTTTFWNHPTPLNSSHSPPPVTAHQPPRPKSLTSRPQHPRHVWPRHLRRCRSYPKQRGPNVAHLRLGKNDTRPEFSQKQKEKISSFKVVTKRVGNTLHHLNWKPQWYMYYTYSIHTFKSSCCKISGVSTVSTVSLVSSPFPNRTRCRQPFHYHQPLSLQRFVWILMCPLLYCSLLNMRLLHVFVHIYKKKQSNSLSQCKGPFCGPRKGLDLLQTRRRDQFQNALELQWPRLRCRLIWDVPEMHGCTCAGCPATKLEPQKSKFRLPIKLRNIPPVLGREHVFKTS